MKESTTIKSYLGLTQEEMAMLLGITASQWSMFKSGKRSLPLEASEQLGLLLKGVQKKKQDSKIAGQFLKTEKEKAKEKRKQDYLKIQIKLHRLAKELEIIESHRSESFAALEAVHYLETQPQEKQVLDLIKSIKGRVDKTLAKYSLYKLEQIQLQKGILETVKYKMEEQLKI